MKKISLFIILFIIVGMVFYSQYTKATPSTRYDVSIAQSKVILENPSIIILDVRPKRDLPTGVLRNAINIDVTRPEFQEPLHKLDKNREYLVYCNTGKRSAYAIAQMEEAGFTKLYHMKDGIEQWKKAHLPIIMPMH